MPIYRGPASGESVDERSGISGTVGLDLAEFKIFAHTLDGNVTYTFDNPASPGDSFTIFVIQDGTGGRSVTWPSSVEWDSGSEPSQTTSANAVDWYGFVTPDGGDTWRGVQSAADMS